ncbi:MAG: TIM barrel protein, partial [Spirochaetales bacterium]
MVHIKGNHFFAGVVHHVSFSHTEIPFLDSTLELLRDSFYNVIEGAWKLNKTEKELFRYAFSTASVECIYCIGGFLRKEDLNLHAFSEDKRRQALEAVKRYIDEAYDLDAKAIVFCSGADPGINRREEAINLFRQSVIELSKYALKKNPNNPIWLNLENFDRELDQCRLLGPTSETVQFLNSLPAECANVGLTLDLSHLRQLGEDIRQAVRTAKDWVIHAHIANCVIDRSDPFCGDKHVRFGFPNSAVTLEDVAAFLHEL